MDDTLTAVPGRTASSTRERAARRWHGGIAVGVVSAVMLALPDLRLPVLVRDPRRS